MKKWIRLGVNLDMITPIDLQAFLEKPVRRSPLSYVAIPAAVASSGLVSEAAPGTSFHAAMLREKPADALPSVAVELAPLLAPDTAFPEFFMDNHAKAMLVQQGISKHAFEHFKKAAHLDYDQLAQLIGVSRKTLINKKGAEVFDRLVSEQLLSLAELYSHGAAALGSLAAFVHWLQVPCRAFGGQLPFGLLATQFGRREVDQVLGRIEWGVYA